MNTSPAREPRLVHAPERQIPEFTLYLEEDGSWVAVHKRDPDLRLAAADWRDLFWACTAARITATLREAAEELASRMAEPGRAWRCGDPDGGPHV
ncbi:hypothetical protein BZB76_1843 [Actinomadura pelletieri DSM 43383]|uniref:Uncharacterized protein n=1 Tax=Actinomadura pelletieri DSM 43383 TaxID=1120940 RepID=A0A495QSS4_9ACTN|nr:hypothetical protein [Actinomadura pelletieri]RKS76487.1 hypothetical protein BZB76_1843 [Actinomadura pelletieri DSM 43383]